MDHESALGIIQSMLANEKDAIEHNKRRLADYIADYEVDPQLDTAAQVGRTREKIVNNTTRIEALEYVAGVLNQDEQIERIYKTAAGLFDPGTVLNTEADEYQRGVTELTMYLLGMDDVDDVAKTITGYIEDIRTPRQKIDAVIFSKFPERLMTFYTTDDIMAAVEDKNGDMWRVWPDGDTERYKR
jgi:hypothetical protein